MSGVSLLDRCVVLDPREALIYPFNLGSDWTEIRLGFTISATRSSGPNVVPTNETLAADAAKNAFYVGLVGWTGDLNVLYDLPRLTGSTLNNVNFLGVSSINRQDGSRLITNTSNSVGYIGGVATLGGNGGTPMFISDSGNTHYVINPSTSTPNTNSYIITLPQNVGSTGFTGFACQNALKIVINNSNNQYQIYCNVGTTVPNIPFYTSAPTVESLRARMAAFDSTLDTRNAVASGYFTHNNLAAGVPQVKPSGVLFYFPFFNNQIRLHAIAVERYA